MILVFFSDIHQHEVSDFWKDRFSSDKSYMVVSSVLSLPLMCAHLEKLTHQTYPACRKESLRNRLVNLFQPMNTPNQYNRQYPKGLK